MNDKYAMNLIVPVRLVGPILELLNGEGVLVKTEPYSEDGKHRKHRFVNGKRDKGISSEQLALDLIGGGVIKPLKIREGFIKRGFAASSSDAALGHLVRKGKIKRVNRTYQLV